MYYGVINEEGLYKRWICKDILRVTTKYVQRLVIFCGEKLLILLFCTIMILVSLAQITLDPSKLEEFKDTNPFTAAFLKEDDEFHRRWVSTCWDC